jgi:cation transport ATPase
MSKSTPLSHLPQQTAVVDAQDDIIAGDDDATIQDVLNQITGGGGGGDVLQQQRQYAKQQATATAQQQQQQQQQQHQQHQQHQQQKMQYMQQPVVDSSAMLNTMMQQTTAPATGNIMNVLMFALTEDFKLASIIFAVYVSVQFIPITRFLERYFNLDKIPYSDILIKGALVAIAVMVVRKAVKN